MNKKNLLLFAVGLIFGIFLTKAQNDNSKDSYYPLLQEGIVWSIVDVDDCGGIWDLKFSPFKVAFFGDTIINDVTYKKTYVSIKEYPEFPHDWSFRNFMREDENKRIWYKESSNSAEKMYYDFSLNIGDTVPESIGFQENIVVVEDITIQVMSNGDERKVLHLSSNCFGFPNTKEFWIEGIGSILGVLSPITGELIGGYSRLLCFHKNGELVFFNENAWGKCFLTSLGITTFENQINIYPNPVKNVLYIENISNLEISSITLINVHGEKIRQYEPNKVPIDVSDLATGMYFIKFTSPKGNIIRKVLVE